MAGQELMNDRHCTCKMRQGDLLEAIERRLRAGKGDPADQANLESCSPGSSSRRRSMRLLADDVTPEKLVSMLAANGGRLACISAEGGSAGHIAGVIVRRAQP